MGHYRLTSVVGVYFILATSVDSAFLRLVVVNMFLFFFSVSTFLSRHAIRNLILVALGSVCALLVEFRLSLCFGVVNG